MAVKTPIGRVGLVLRGEYDPGTPYVKLDVVYSGNGSYVCRKPCTGVPVTNAEYWQVIVSLDDVADDMSAAVEAAERATQAATEAAGTANSAARQAVETAQTAAEQATTTAESAGQQAVQIAQTAGAQAVANANTAGNEAKQTAQTAANAANTAAGKANSAANALQNISFDINANAEMEVTIPWQS